MGAINPAQDYFFNFGVILVDHQGKTVEVPESIGAMVATTHVPASGSEEEGKTIASKPCWVLDNGNLTDELNKN